MLVCRVEVSDTDQITELAAFDRLAADVCALQPQTALDELEMTTQITGNAILRCVLQAQCNFIDAELTEQHRQHFSPQPVHADGHEMVTVASRFGTLALSRQLCWHPQTQTHLMPGNPAVPAHNGIIITRSLQE